MGCAGGAGAAVAAAAAGRAGAVGNLSAMKCHCWARVAAPAGGRSHRNVCNSASWAVAGI